VGADDSNVLIHSRIIVIHLKADGMTRRAGWGRERLENGVRDPALITLNRL
jgi:hypothetical protein